MCGGPSGGGSSYDNRSSLRSTISFQNEAQRYEQETARLAAERAQKEKVREWNNQNYGTLLKLNDDIAKITKQLDSEKRMQASITAAGGQYTMEPTQLKIQDLTAKKQALEDDLAKVSGSEPFEYKFNPVLTTDGLEGADSLKRKLDSLQNPNYSRSVSDSVLYVKSGGLEQGAKLYKIPINESSARSAQAFKYVTELPEGYIEKNGAVYYEDAGDRQQRLSSMETAKKDYEDQKAFEDSERNKFDVFNADYIKSLEEAEAKKQEEAAKQAAELAAKQAEEEAAQAKLKEQMDKQTAAAKSAPTVADLTKVGATDATKLTPKLEASNSAYRKKLLSEVTNSNQIQAPTTGYSGQSNKLVA